MKKRQTGLRAGCLSCVVILSAGLGFAEACKAQVLQTSEAYDIVQAPTCANNKGEVVRFIDGEGGRAGAAAGMARRNESGEPIVVRWNFSAIPPAFQSFIDLHECAHHQTGDVDRPHPPRNGPEHLMNESISDCVAALRLRDEENYDTERLVSVTSVLRSEMAKIGFPEISISSRISNIENCFRKPGTAQAFVDGVLRKRGLLQP